MACRVPYGSKGRSRAMESSERSPDQTNLRPMDRQVRRACDDCARPNWPSCCGMNVVSRTSIATSACAYVARSSTRISKVMRKKKCAARTRRPLVG